MTHDEQIAEMLLKGEANLKRMTALLDFADDMIKAFAEGWIFAPYSLPEQNAVRLQVLAKKYAQERAK